MVENELIEVTLLYATKFKKQESHNDSVTPF